MILLLIFIRTINLTKHFARNRATFSKQPRAISRREIDQRHGNETHNEQTCAGGVTHVTRKTAANRITGANNRIAAAADTPPWIYVRVRAFNGGNLRRTIRSPASQPASQQQQQPVVLLERCIASGFNGIYFGPYLLSAAIAAAIRTYIRDTSAARCATSNGTALNGIRARARARVCTRTR